MTTNLNWIAYAAAVAADDLYPKAWQARARAKAQAAIANGLLALVNDGWDVTLTEPAGKP